MKIFKCPSCKRVCKFKECVMKVCAACDCEMEVVEDG